MSRERPVSAGSAANSPAWQIPEKWKKLHPDLLAEAAPLNDKELKTYDIMVQQLGTDAMSKVPLTVATRFIRGYSREKEPIKEAVEKFREALKFRVENHADELLHQNLERMDVFRKYWPGCFHGHCKQGRPIYWERVGAMDPEKVMTNFDIPTLQRFHIQTMEQLSHSKEEISNREGRMMYKHVAVVDLGGFGAKHLSSSFTGPMKAFVNIDQFYYPESLYKLIVINAPWLFKMFWAIVRPWIHPLTADRIKIGSHYLREYINEDQLPHYVGGKCTKCCGKCIELPYGCSATDEKPNQLADAGVAAIPTDPRAYAAMVNTVAENNLVPPPLTVSQSTPVLR